MKEIDRYKTAIRELRDQGFGEPISDIEDYVSCLHGRAAINKQPSDAIWDNVVNDMGGYKLYNIFGPSRASDQFMNAYKTYAIGHKGVCNEDKLKTAATEKIINMVDACSHIKPEGHDIRQRDVYIVWRQFPEISFSHNEFSVENLKNEISGPIYNINWRMNIYDAGLYQLKVSPI